MAKNEYDNKPGPDKKVERPLGRIGPLAIMRRYNKQIMIGAGVFLMIAFLVPQALQQVGQNTRGRVAFYLNDEPVKGGRLAELQRQLQFLEYTGLPFEFGGSLGIDRITGVEHWAMLVKAATDGGYIGGANYGRLAYTARSDEEARRFAEQRFGRARSRMGMTDEQAGRAMATYMGVMRMIGDYESAARVSPARVVNFVADLEDAAVVDLVVLPPAYLDDRVEVPDEQALADFCYEYRDVEAGEGEFGFGFRQPAQVKFEYLMIDRAIVQDTIDVDRFEARKYFLQNRESLAPKNADGTPAIEPELLEYDNYREQVKGTLREQQVDERLGEMERVIQDEFTRSRKGLASADQVFELPDDWANRQTDFEGLADRLADRYGIERPTVVRREAAWTPLSGFRNDGFGIEGAYATLGRSRLPLSQIVRNIREVEDQTDYSYQKGIAFGPLSDNLGNRYFVRVTDARPARPAMATVEADEPDPAAARLAMYRALEPEVTSAVADAARRRAAYDTFVADAATWRQKALDDGLDAIAAETGIPVSTDVPITRLAPGSEVPTIDGIGQDETFVAEVHDVIEPLDPEADLAELPAEERLITRVIPGTQSMAIALVQDRRPVDQETYQLIARFVMMQMAGSELRDVAIDLPGPFTLPSLVERYDYRLPKRLQRRIDQEREAGEGGEQVDDGGSAGDALSPDEDTTTT
jgi:hypothetical protein